MSRNKIYPSESELLELGFEEKNNGGDHPFDYWYEIDLTNKESSPYKIILAMDGAFDFSLEIEGLDDNIPLNFQSVEEIKVFISIFKRPYNHMFSSLLDVSEKTIT